jgi:L-ascorbate metabolism protein UlaG (beta-lactamase superfamily)
MRVLAALLAMWPAFAGAEALQSNCQALAEGPGIELAGFGAPLNDAVRLRYVTHAEFAIETPGGALAVTDYNGLLGNPDVVPDVVTMNHAHPSHYTDHPDPRIPLVLRGWPNAGRAAFWDLQVKDLHIRNVTTDTRGPFGEGAQKDGNSIFLFEAAGLCIAHLGHLHQVPSPVQYAAIGRVDVVMLPVDGGYTMNLASMRQVALGLHARVILPMHWFSPEDLANFLALMQNDYAIREVQGPDVELSLATLPERQTILVLTPALIP